MRLDRFLSETTGLSRVAAKKTLHTGAVTVDGEACKQTSRILLPGQQVRLNGELLALRGPVYLMMNKPAGTVCSAVADAYPTVFSLLPEDTREGLHVAGRLDQDTTGLVLLTDDGQWSHRVTSPKKACGKVYRATLAEPLDATAEARCAEGLMLKGEDKPTLPARLERLSDTEVRLTLQEGKYHQVKRMFAALGNRVLSLHRERVGGLCLDPALAAGESRLLTADEVLLAQG